MLLERPRTLGVTFQKQLSGFIFVSANILLRYCLFSRTFILGILLFYILGTLVIGLLVPSNSPALNLSGTMGTAGTAAASPFVIAIERAGIKALPSVNTSCLCTWVVSNGYADNQRMSADIRVVGGLK